MKTVQKYGEGANHASQIEESAATPPQSVENAPQSANTPDQAPVLPANEFTFDELATFADMPSGGKAFICSLLESKIFTPDQLSRALAFVAHNPDITSLDNEALQSVLADPNALPPFALENKVGLDSAPITINLPPFLRQQIRDVEHTKRLLAALDLVFYEFSRSEPGRKIRNGEDVDQQMAYTALGLCVNRIIEDAARQIGTFQKLKGADVALFDAPTLVAGDSLIPNPELVDNDPQAFTDVVDLQAWVIDLQRIVQDQQKLLAIHQKLDDSAERAITAQGEVVKVLEETVKLQQQQIESYQAKEAKPAPTYSTPIAKGYIDLTIYFGAGYESEAELVRAALNSAAEQELKDVFANIASDDTVGAFYAKENYDKLMSVAGRLSQEITEAASDNYSHSEYHRMGNFHVAGVKRREQREETRRAAFVEAYSVTFEPEGKDDTEADQPAATQE